MMPATKGSAKANPNARCETHDEVRSTDASPSGSQLDRPGTTYVKVEPQDEELPSFEVDDEEYPDQNSETAPALKAIVDANGEGPTTDTEAHPQEKDDNNPQRT